MPRKKKATHQRGRAIVYLVLDKSGSMAPLVGDTIAGYNHFLAKMREADPTAHLYLTLFDTGVTQPLKAVPVGVAPNLDSRVYSPGGGTALLDAIGRSIKEIDDLPEEPERVVFVITTDGEENSSHEYSKAAIKALIEKREKQDWQFVYLGANQDAFSEAGGIGIHRAGSSVTYVPNSAGTQVLYAAVASASSDFMRGTASTVTMSQDTYDQALNDLSTSSTSTTPLTIDQKINRRAAKTATSSASK